MDTCQMLHPDKHIFFSHTHKTFTKIDYIFSHQKNCKTLVTSIGRNITNNTLIIMQCKDARIY